MNVVLYSPQIPQNTGNIARTCAVTETALHLIGPYGFAINEASVKRAGLDYWHSLKITEYADFDDFLSKNPQARLVLATSHGSILFTDFCFLEDDFLLFGNETAGLPDCIHDAYPDTRVKIPMGETFSDRCLNLSNAVAVVLYEAYRQLGFPGLR